MEAVTYKADREVYPPSAGRCEICGRLARYRATIGDPPLSVCEECTGSAWRVAAAVEEVRTRGYTVEAAPDAYGRVSFRLRLRHYPARLMAPADLANFAAELRGWKAAAQYARFDRAWYGEAIAVEGAPAGTTPLCETEGDARAMAEEIILWHIVGGPAPAWGVE